MLRLLESGMIFKFPVITCTDDGLINFESLHSHESGILASMSRSDTSSLKLNILYLIGLSKFRLCVFLTAFTAKN